ncbi:MFS transporter [Streptomyces sp. S.PB5]|uniref:MFS transporter n=1 Tax=Streptomyces sp. S.PB5 TaxID=3020844 RepID=UPI0025B0E680|nr:MFS transporter [Streptomyces sp. S.PB5]MDN3027062.1 MFS transporter [Streptomyces sp. S.PB5]
MPSLYPAGAAADTAGSTAPDPNRWQALWITLIAGFMILLDVTIVAVALPSMQRDLHATPASVQWVVSGYALTFALALVVAGRLGDALGRRRIFLLSLSAFVLCSAAVGAAPTVTLVVLARLAQGVAAGFMAPQNSALIQQLFRGSERARAFGLFSATVGISSAVGPVAGGVILALATGPEGWQWIFYVNVPVGVAAVLLGQHLLPRTAPGSRGHLDLVGVGLLGAAVFALMLPLVQADSGGVRHMWWMFPVGALLLCCFARWERQVSAQGLVPLLDPRLITEVRGYTPGVALATVYFVGFSGIWLVFALYFQDAVGYSPLRSGLAVTPFALGSAGAAVVASRLVDRLGRLLTVLGLVAVVTGLTATALLLWLLPARTAVWALIPTLLLSGVGGGFVVSPNVTMALREVPIPMAGVAGGALQTGQRLGGAVGTAVLPGLYYLILGDHASSSAAVALSVTGGTVTILVALGLAVVDWRADRRASGQDAVDRSERRRP